MGAHAKKRKKERKDINRVFPGKKKKLESAGIVHRSIIP